MQIEVSGGQRLFFPMQKNLLSKIGIPGIYHEKHIPFGDNIKAEEFRSWIISDGASSVVNIIQSIQKLILFGEEKGFGEASIC